MKSITACLAENLKSIRKKKGLTREALAEKAGISAQSIYYIESESRWPRVEMVSALAAALEVPEAALFESKDSKVNFEDAWEVVLKKVEKSVLKKDK